VWHAELWQWGHNPVRAMKEIYWEQPHGAKTGVSQVLLTFFGFSFVSPEYSWVTLGHDLPVMRDFRGWSFSPAGLVAMPLWLAFWLAGAVAAASQPRFRWLAAGLFAAVLFNVLLHMDFQERGSLYLYAAHAHFPIFALGTGLATFTQSSRWRAAYLVAVVVLAALVGPDNLTVVAHFTGAFDQAPVPAG
jgi:hypothetical protein